MGFKLLRTVSGIVFAVACILLVGSLVVDMAAERVEVRNPQGSLIGDAWVSFHYGSAIFTCFSFALLSGLQYWSMRYLAHMIEDKQSLNQDTHSQALDQRR